MGRVSIITPLHNGGDFIAKTLASVQNQSFGDYEHLIIDDRSTDDGLDIVRRAAFYDPRIRLLTNFDAPGAGPARNVGISAARGGSLIAFLDCDDTWAPTKLERQVTFMEASGLAFSWTGYRIVDEADALLRIQNTPAQITYDDLLKKRAVIGCLTAMYDTRRIGRHFMNHLRMRQDFCLWLDILRYAERRLLPVEGLPEPLADYRVHSRGMTSSKLRAARWQWRAYRDHVGLSTLEAASCFASYGLHALRQRTG